MIKRDLSKRMKEEGIPLYKEEESSFIALKWKIGFEIRKALEKITNQIIAEVLENVKDEQIIDVVLTDSFDLMTTDEFRDKIKKLSERYLNEAEYIDTSEAEQTILFTAQVIDKIKLPPRRKPVLEDEE